MARTAARTAHRPTRTLPVNLHPDPAARSLRSNDPGCHHRGTLIGLGQHPPGSGSSTRMWKSRTRPPAFIRKLCTVPRVHAALLDPEPGERRRQEPRMVAVEVRDQAVDLGGRGPRSPARPPPTARHLAAPSVGSGLVKEPSDLYHPDDAAAGPPAGCRQLRARRLQPPARHPSSTA